MIAILTTAGRLLLAHWPAILAWFLAGVLANYAVIQVAGWVGAYSAIGGALLLPIAMLVRLISYVAMFLVVRDGMRQLDAVAPLPESPAERREALLNALLGAILPFVAFYAAWGLMREDYIFYIERVLARNTDLVMTNQDVGDGAVGELSLGFWTIVLIAVAFGLRWLLKRYREKLPKAFTFVAVYLEVLWVYLTVMLISDGIAMVTTWVKTRQAVVWLSDVREWVAAQLAPVAWLWDAIEWLLGEAGGIILLPLAWLTIAGVVYGQAIAPQQLRIRGALADKALSRWARTPQWLRARLAGLWSEVTSRFQPITRSIMLMWRAGPLLIGGYVLLYTLLLGLEPLLGIGITRIIGPRDLQDFWMVYSPLIFLIIPIIVEPLRIVLVSSSYDAVTARLLPQQTDDAVEAQGSTMSLMKSGSFDEGTISTANGPVAASGTMKSAESV